MVVAISAREKLIWSVTSQQIRDNWNVFQFYLKGQSGANRRWDFGRGEEAAFLCPECRRYYPLFTATIDHVVPRSEIRIEYTGSMWGNYFSGTMFKFKTNGQFSVIPFDTDRRAYRLKYRIGRDGMMHCTQLFSDEEIFCFDPQDVLKNMLDNLQPMCSHCNSCKGNRF